MVKIITTSVVFFVFAFILQLLVLRIFNPKKVIHSLFFIFFVIVPLLIILYTVFNFKILLLYYLIAAAYIQTFPAIQADSPSLKIIDLIGNSKDGLKKEEIINAFLEESLREERLRDLINEGLIVKKNEELILTKKGKFLAKTFILYRKILGLKRGAG